MGRRRDTTCTHGTHMERSLLCSSKNICNYNGGLYSHVPHAQMHTRGVQVLPGGSWDAHELHDMRQVVEIVQYATAGRQRRLRHSSCPGVQNPRCPNMLKDVCYLLQPARASRALPWEAVHLQAPV